MSGSKSSHNDNAGIDTELAARAADGDSDAFRHLVDRHRGDLRRFVDLRIDGRLRGRLDASDIVQETLVRAHQELPSYVERRPMPFRVWLLKTAVDLTRDLRIKHLKRQRRSVQREVALPDKSSMMLAKNLSRTHSPSGVAMKKEQMRAVASLICNMGESDREVLVLRHIEDLKFDEIAAILEITAVAARKRYTRALLRLQQLCADKGIT